MSCKPLTTCAAILTACLAAGAALAHGDGFPSLYVSETGVDTGKCVDPLNPCGSIAYALAVAEKGDEIRVAAGSFSYPTLRREQALDLLGSVIRVRGGFDPASRFETRAGGTRVTYLTGPDASYRARLAENGLLLLGDDDGRERLLLAQAEAPAGPVGHVSEGGTDSGDCGNPNAPCATIAYAVSQAVEGQEIRVAEGYFELDPQVLADATARQITIEGGFARASAFGARAAAPDVAELATVVSGPSYAARTALAEGGIRLQQDRKHRDIAPVTRAAALKGPATCTDGLADGHPCKGIDRLAQMPLAVFSTQPGEANDIWGFVDQNDNREYAIIGLENGAAVVDVTDPQAPVEIGSIPGLPTIWRDAKVYQRFDEAAGRWKAYAYVTADDRGAQRHGIAVIDLTELPQRISLAATLDLVDVAHNVYVSNVDYVTGVALPGMTPYLYILGSDFGSATTIGAFFVLDLTDPVNPAMVQSPPADATYSHDATTLLIDDARASVCSGQPCEVLIDYSEDAVDIWDVTDKGAARKLSSITYADKQYIHSGWWTEDKTHVLIQDELDESDGNLNTTVRVLDISDLEAPRLASTWTGPTRAIDHNGFTLGTDYYISNYRRGLTVLDISDPANIAEKNPGELALFDTYVEDPADDARFNGAWGNYPFLPSGTILVSDIEGGLFLLKRQ
ncbi:choice-of-anchor B family protein [Paracoccus spongiarum]|uniref:Choice-of-anchor B family protein n=1 Tax=Paracoccus spongiarum TaxID=3064387 RepID=A0ABT9JCM3_9RHOB|nr:choice-of-anchor B family protein [Paracoccus sp. 2205BS29-5]MDP5307556.1 choice-of-anchor B family protein [Paracoccus sp. 2205BS29-5]